MKIISTLLLLVFTFCGTAIGQEISEGEQEKLDKISSLMNSAGSLFIDGNFRRSASRVRSAQALMMKLAGEGNEAVIADLEKDYNRIKKASSMLVDKFLEFDELPEYADLATAAAEMAAGDAETGEGDDGGDAEAVSFTSQVAPILVRRCARCHVREARGEFSAATFKSIKIGTPDGSVIKDGDPAKSAFIDLIESGDMPPKSNGFPPAELKLLKDWISQGAKYDGEDEEQNVTEMGDSNEQGDRANRGSRRGGGN